MTEQEQEAFYNYRRNRMIAKTSNILGNREAMEMVGKNWIFSEDIKLEREVTQKTIDDKNKITPPSSLDERIIHKTASGSEPRKDTGKHYRFQIEVPVTQADAERGFTTYNLDPFRVAAVYGITNFAQQTALKKVMCAGNRGHKNLLQDIDDIITALDRWKQMLHEDELLVKAKQSPRISEQNHTKPDTGSNGGWMCYE